MSQTIAFNVPHLGLGGVEVAIHDYAYWNRELLGNRSIILTPRKSPGHTDEGASRYAGKFEIFPYKDLEDRDHILAREQADFFYLIKPGVNDGPLPGACKTGVHAVFMHKDPHGDVYAYISEWLARAMSAGELPFVPHIVDLPDSPLNMREKLGIPADARVFGRHGSINTFDIPFVHEIVAEYVDFDPQAYFLFLNTAQFCAPHPRIIHLPGSSNVLYKVAFINTCDAMLHARKMGETFGLAVAEFSYLGKPVITWSGSYEKCHLELLGETGLYYYTPDDLIKLLKTFAPGRPSAQEIYRQQFSPQKVMAKFKEVFLQQS